MNSVLGSVLCDRGVFRNGCVATIVGAFFQQAEDEKGHGLRLNRYVADAGRRMVISTIDERPNQISRRRRDQARFENLFSAYLS
jgi:ferritin